MFYKMNNRKRDRVEIKYQSKSEIYIDKFKKIFFSIINPLITISIIIFSLYILGYIIFIVLAFLLILYLYNKVKNSIK